MPKLRIAMKITRKGGELAKRLANAKGSGLNRAADFLAEELRKVVSTPNPFKGNRHNLDAGKPPFKRSGEGMESIHRTGTGRISMLKRMAMLDRGTKRIEPRPWYHVTIERLRKR